MLLNALAYLALAAAPALAAFGVSTSGSLLTCDTGGGLVFQINTASGDIRSLIYNGIECQDQSKFTHIASGFGKATVTSKIVSNTYAVISVSSSALGPNIIQSYVVKSGTPTIFMTTNYDGEPSVGELRFLARLRRAALPNGPKAADMLACKNDVVEGSDVFRCSDGTTRSKYYSSQQFIDQQVYGVTGSGVGAFIVRPGNAYETSSGGPFFRDIAIQGSDQQEITAYINSGHYQTEAYRFGLSGVYALVFTGGSTPSGSLDTSFFSGLGIKGYVADSQRGRVTGRARGIPAAFDSQIVVGWSNSGFQYWTRATTSGLFASPYMVPGIYTQTLYKSELAVATSTVTVSAGSTATMDISSAEAVPSVIWQVGERDGTPRGFLNADKIETMHPSDSRMAAWPAGSTYIVGGSAVSSFPMALFKSVNAPITVSFTLSSSQLGARTFEIGTTSNAAGGRPTVQVNGVATGGTPPSPNAPSSRGVTRGTWRGPNTIYATAIPAGRLVAGKNTITISIASGQTAEGFLSPSVVFDFLRLY